MYAYTDADTIRIRLSYTTRVFPCTRIRTRIRFVYVCRTRLACFHVRIYGRGYDSYTFVVHDSHVSIYIVYGSAVSTRAR